MSVGTSSNLSGTLNVANGGIVTVAGNTLIGGQNVGSRTGVGAVTVTGAGSQLTSSGVLNIGPWGQGTLTVSDRAVATANAVTMATASLGKATLNLSNGGVLATQSLTTGPGTAQVNFDGGTLRATASNTAFISGFTGTELNIAAGALTLDTAGFTVTAASPFSGTGALTKIGPPAKDALGLEKADGNPYANVLVTTPKLADDPRIARLSKLLTSPEVAKFIREHYQGSVIPVNN